VNITLPDRLLGCQVVASSFDQITCVNAMPTARTAVPTAPAAHTYADGFDGALAVAINDFAGGGCGSDPAAPAGWGAGVGWTVATAHAAAQQHGFGCEFDFVAAASSRLASVAPAVGHGPTSLTLTGSGFSAEPTVLVGATACVVTGWTATEVQCDVPAVTAGRYNIRGRCRAKATPRTRRRRPTR
jgi:hypothetical protein